MATSFRNITFNEAINLGLKIATILGDREQLATIAVKWPEVDRYMALAAHALNIQPAQVNREQRSVAKSCCHYANYGGGQ